MAKDKTLRPTDEAAVSQARDLIETAAFAALGVLDPVTSGPSVTRIAVAPAPDGSPVTLISSLSGHTAALRSDPRCSLLLGEPGAKGDPLTHPRLTLQCRAVFLDRDGAAHTEMRSHYLAARPKAKLYVDFADFQFVRFEITQGFMNGGFGKAYVFAASDLAPAHPAP